jgi:hypothetical protein
VAVPRGRTSSTEGGHGIRYVSWRSHVEWLRGHLLPGQHILILNPTGGGKSYLVVGPDGIIHSLPVLEHARILFVDDKGRDRTTRGFGIPIPQYPPHRRARPPEGTPEHYRLVVPDWSWSPDRTHVAGTEHARKVVAESLDAFYKEAEDPDDPESSEKAKASVVVLDETFALTDREPPSLNLAPLVKRGLRKARFKGQTMVCLSQAPLGLPSDCYTQPTHFYIGQMLDRRYRERLREIGGNSPVIEECVATLEEREFLFLGNKGRHMHIVMAGR